MKKPFNTMQPVYCVAQKFQYNNIIQIGRRSSYEKYVEDDAGSAGGVLRELRHGAGRQITATNQG